MSEMTQNLTEFFVQHPGMKFIFFGGKGGVGKTVMAGVAALHLAMTGKRTILASTNPVHSLSGLLDQNVYGKPTAVTGVPNLWAYEIDTKDTIERSKQDIKQKIRWFLKFAEVSTQADAFVESATMNPAFEESAMFENMVDLMFKNEYDAYVFDTAPTANARRLLGMSKVYSLWVNKMVKSREEAQSLRELLSFTKKKEQDPLMEYLLTFRERIGHARELLTDAPVGGVIVNMLIQKDQVRADSPEFVRNRVAMQDSYMQEIWRDFDNLRAIVPLLDDEVRGTQALQKVAEYVFAPATRLHT